MGPVGVLGLGLLGSAIAGCLSDAGYTVWGFDPDAGARERAAGLGVRTTETPKEVASASGCLVLSLPDSDVRRELLFGDGGLAEALEEGTLLVDTTTGRAQDLVDDAERLQTLDVYLVDVCVLASSAQVASKEAVLLVGDEASRARGYAPVLETFSNRIFYLDNTGDGAKMKLVANLALGLHRLVLAEALGLAGKAGLDPGVALEVLQSGAAASAVMGAKGERMLSGDFAPVARLAQHAKDVDLILELGRACGAHLPLSALHRDVLAGLVDAGYGGEDNAAVIRAFCGEGNWGRGGDLG